MKIVVQGLWHLGSVTAACCAQHFEVIGIDNDPDRINKFNAGEAPLLEPGLNDLIISGIASSRLHFSTNYIAAAHEADLLWVTYDTPVNDQDESDILAVLTPIRETLPHLKKGTPVLISAQLPVETCRQLEAEFPLLNFACSPENLRLGKAIESFTQAERAIVGLRDHHSRDLIETLFHPFAKRVIFMRTESAEMVKHALNSFLALSITFINEIALLCEPTGADAQEVSRGLKSEPRIGLQAYLGPGGPFAGGTLARDVVTLTRLAGVHGIPNTLIPAIKLSNDQHRNWAFRRLSSSLCELKGKTIALLGLVYTPSTDTLRRSSAVELAVSLLGAGAIVKAYDPAIQKLPIELKGIILMDSPIDAINDADAVVICTEWPEFRKLDWPHALASMRAKRVLDANRYLEKQIGALSGVEYTSVGRPGNGGTV